MNATPLPRQRRRPPTATPAEAALLDHLGESVEMLADKARELADTTGMRPEALLIALAVGYFAPPR